MTLKPFVLIGVIAVSVGVLAFVRTDPEHFRAMVHVSGFDNEVAYIDEQIAHARLLQPLELHTVRGGVAPHHIPTAIPLLADFYARLARDHAIDTFVIIGPDHLDKSVHDASISNASFRTQFGTLDTDHVFVDQLVKTGLVSIDEAPFGDHSINAQAMFISRLFPHAKIVPIILRTSGSNEQAEELGRRIGELAGPRTFVIASVDFSHYLNEQQAEPLDAVSAQRLMTLDPKRAGLAEADSPQSLTAMVAAVRAMEATKAQVVGTYNSSAFTQTTDFTTGYVLMYFGE